MRSDRIAVIAIAAIVVLAGLFLLGAVLIGAWFDQRNEEDLGRVVGRPGAYATAERGGAPCQDVSPAVSPAPSSARIS